MALLSKTTVATAVFAVISSQAVSQAYRDFKSDMAYMYRSRETYDRRLTWRKVIATRS